MDLEKGWIINGMLTVKEREILFILLEAADIPVYIHTRMNTSSLSRYPYIGYGGRLGDNVSGWECRSTRIPMEIVEYEEVIETLKELITKQSKKTWTLDESG